MSRFVCVPLAFQAAGVGAVVLSTGALANVDLGRLSKLYEKTTHKTANETEDPNINKNTQRMQDGNKKGGKELRTETQAVVGALSGAIARSLVAPLEVVKIRYSPTIG